MTLSNVNKPPEWLKKMPSDPLMAIAWRDCLVWAIGEPRILAEFERDTGVRYAKPGSPLDAMIDEATGHNAIVVEKFVEWFQKNVWGD